MKDWKPKVTILLFTCLVGFLFFALLPIYKGNIQANRITKCLSNMKQISTSAATYAVDHNGAFPPNAWIDALMPYAKDEEFFTCPTLRHDGYKWGYALNVQLNATSTKFIEEPERTVLFFETETEAKNVIATLSARMQSRHKTGSVIAYVDTSAKFIQAGSPP